MRLTRVLVMSFGAAYLLLGCKESPPPVEVEPSPSPESLSALAPTPFYYPDFTTPVPGAEGDLPAGKTAGADTKPGYSPTGAPPADSSLDPAATWSPTEAEMETALNDYGAWEQGPEQSKVWVPTHPGADWQPYVDGQWINSQHGWIWQGNEPWAWLPYHYGHWTWLPRGVWAWRPGPAWVPSQVAWRADDQYVAWAPSRPGIDPAAIPPAAWIVVPVARFLDAVLRPAILPPARVVTVLPRTKVMVATRPVGRIGNYYLGPEPVMVRRWVPAVPAAVTVHHWRAAAPVRYATHYDRGRHVGWYKPAVVAPPPRARVDVDRVGPGREIEVETGNRRRGTEVEVERNPGRGREVEVEHHSPRGSVEVERDRRGRHTEVEVDRKGPRRDVEVERNGRRTTVDVDR